MRRRKRDNLKLILIILLISMSLGYALLNTDLTITGTGKINGANWSVYFDNIVINSNSIALSDGDSLPTINSTTLTDITYTVTLKEPGDFYEFTVDVVNDGSLDAMIGTISKKLNNAEISSTNPLPPYVHYTITYSDGTPIAENQILSKNSTDTYKVRLAFRTDIDPEDLPTSGDTIQLEFGVSYIQKDNRGVSVLHSIDFATDSWETIIANIQSGNISNYQVGDTKTVELGNDLGTHTLRIANTSTPSECSTEGFSQTACGFVLEFADIITTHRMNPYDETGLAGDGNIGGWTASEIRTYLNDTNDSTSIINSLPTIIKNAIVDTTVVSGHGSTTGEANFTSTDKIYLLSTHEVFEDTIVIEGEGIDDLDMAYDNTRQLDYYADLGVTTSNYSEAIKQSNGSNDYWWLRSSFSSYNSGFFNIDPMGSWNNYISANTFGVSPAFRIG